MDDSPYNELKSSLSSVPARALNYSCRLILSRNLDIKQLLISKKGHARDYRGFAELMGFQFSETKKFERCEDPTLKILEAWETHPDATLDKLIEFLEEMERYDVIKEIIPSIEKDAVAFKQSQSIQNIPLQVAEVTSCPVSVSSERGILTRDDLRTGECTFYDAYVSYADTCEEDSCFVQKLANLLESPEIGLKLFIQGRDMLAGSSELETNLEMIQNRCKRMLIILTNNFIQSKHCAYQVRFAASLSIEQRERLLIPVLLSPCEVPSVLLTISKIDFTKPNVYEWTWDRLVASLLPKSKYSQFLQSHHAFPIQKTSRLNQLETVTAANNQPVITYPETVKQLALPLNKTYVNSTSIKIPVERPLSQVSTEVVCEIPSVEVSAETASPIFVENVSKLPQTTVKSKSKSLKNTFYSYLRKGRSSSSSISSNNSSGFCSESTF